MELVKKADERKIKWRVRYALGETLCNFAEFVPVELIKTDIFNIYMDFLKDKE